MLLDWFTWDFSVTVICSMAFLILHIQVNSLKYTHLFDNLHIIQVVKRVADTEYGDGYTVQETKDKE